MTVLEKFVGFVEKLPEPVVAALLEAVQAVIEGRDPTPGLERAAEEQARQRAFDELMKESKG